MMKSKFCTHLFSGVISLLLIPFLMKKTKLLYCAIAFFFILALSSCSAKAETALLQYEDILRNGFGLSQSEVVTRYQIDESTVEKSEKEDSETWTIPSQENMVTGYPASVFLTFKEDKLNYGCFAISIKNNPEETWQALLDIYGDMEEKLGDISENWTSQQPFSRFSDYDSFLEAITPSLESDGLYLESNHWNSRNSDDSENYRAELSLSMYESGNSTIELRIQKP